VSATARWQAWTTDVALAVADPARLPDSVRVLRRRMDDVELACSRFRHDSETTRLRPGRQRVGPVLAELLAAALWAAEATDGLVVPTLGRSLVAAGYDRSLPALPADGPAAVPVPPAADWRALRLDRRLLDLPDGVQLDLGATAKAWLVDDVAAHLTAAGTTALVCVGGDLAVAGDPPDDGWPVAVGDPGGPVDVVEVRSALATSSTVRRTWRRGGAEAHHVLDPSTGAPAPRTWRTVSVAAATCLEANAASTSAVVLGPMAPKWLQHRGFAARLVAADGDVVLCGGWRGVT
jgi:thiamine biosynthesis lipoprotein